MRERRSRTVIELDVLDHNGEIRPFKAVEDNVDTYYSITNITSRINAMDMFTIMEKTCKSAKDISVFNALTERTDKENKVRIDNISDLAKTLEVSRPKLTMFLKALVTNGFFHKLDRGVYMINPIIFVGRRVRSNALRAEAQANWRAICDNQLYLSIPNDPESTGVVRDDVDKLGSNGVELLMAEGFTLATPIDEQWIIYNRVKDSLKD